ncbi:MAG TPA: hypothetical protein VIX89_13220 [Bryobacteraceae bacterium]
MTTAMKASWRVAGFPLVLLAVNVYFTKELFTLEYSQYMGSIEAAFISISRYMLDNWRDLTWFPLWYGGIPFQNTYPPLLHGIVAATAGAFRISPASAYHAVTACMYCAGPAALYFLAVRLTGSRWYAFWAGWIYSIFSPSYFLMASVHAGLGGQLGPRRLQTLVFYGEGPHITSLTLLPVALLALDVALVKRRPLWYLLAAAGMTLVALSNWLGAVALAIAVFAYLLAYSGGSGGWKIWGTAAGIAMLAYALACSWIPPSTIRDIRNNAQYVGPFQHVYRTLPLYAAVLILATLLVKYCMQRFRISQALQFFGLFALLASAIPLASDWAGVAIVPQPERYHLEMDLAICLLVAFGLKAVAGAVLADRFLTVAARKRQVVLAALVLALSYYPARLDRRYARRMIKPVDIFQTIEYKTALWFRDHLDGQRVLAEGTISYWLNAFADTPQFGGGFDQGRVNRANGPVQYQIYSADGAGDKAAEIAVLWFRAFGVQAVAVGGATSKEEFKPFRRPDVFAASLPEAWREGGDAVYRAPQRTASLAHVVGRGSLVRDPPANGLDVQETRAYVQALENPNYPVADFRWTSRHSAEIRAAFRQDDLLSVQVTYHPGWHALVKGKPRRVFGDGLGQLVIEPNCVGQCGVQLIYDGGLEMLTARIVCWSALAGSLIWIAASWRRRAAQ